MKISVDNKDLFTLSETQKKVIKDYLHEDIFEDDMRRRLHWVLTHLHDEAFKRLKAEWEPKLLANGVKSFPADPEEFAELVFKQPQYKNRKQREMNV